MSEGTQGNGAPRGRSRMGKVARVVAWTAGVLLLLVVILLGGLAWYSTTESLVDA